ncbi:twin-arginine translocation signal domain-containing protein [Natronomonas halophila]|uniref:ABC transporter substrate-binding protein n=1 Tax=Natronomonas halophila TaxID=2747817 RepID=UPI0015B3A905|nr:ABC transporter substrate-binding protein [Natronomonas halophila]QLD86753.1 twin-arginine translocation signal domain-containing protein [Natronomonas halophila]
MPDKDSLSRRTFLKATGGTAGAVAIAGCGDSGNGNGNGNGDGDTPTPTPEDEPVYTTEAPKAQEAWETVENNPGPEAEDIRTEAFIEIEEAVRDDMVLLPLYHELTEWFWYDWVDMPKFGSLGIHRLQHNTTSVDTSSDQKSENVLVMINGTMSTIDPIRSDDTASGRVIQQMYENLVNYINGNPEIENQLAESIEVSDDGLTYTFNLKQGVTYHEGGELTAADVKYSIRRLAESSNSVRANFVLDSGFLGVEHETDDEGNVVPDSLAVEAVDDYTLEMTLTTPQPAALDILAYDAFGVMPEGTVGDIEGYDGEVTAEEINNSYANGTGPFQFEEWSVGEQAEVTAFGDYHGDGPALDGVRWSIIEDDNAHQTAYVERNLDLFTIPTSFYNPDNVDAEEDDQGRDVGTYGPLENGDTVNYLGVPTLSVFYVAFNVPQVPKKVRQSVAYVTHHQELIDQVFKGRGAPAFSFTPPGMWPTGPDGYNQWVDNWPYSRNETDRESATQALNEAGFTADDPFEMTLTTYDSEVFQEFGRLTRDKLDGTGISLELETAPFNTLISRGEEGDLEFYSLGWIWSWVDPAYGLFGFEPENTDTSIMPTETDGYYLDWHVGLEDYESGDGS